MSRRLMVLATSQLFFSVFLFFTIINPLQVSRGQGIPGAGVVLKGEVLVPDKNANIRIRVSAKSSGIKLTDTAERFSVLLKKFPDTVTFSSVGLITVVRIFRSPKDVPDLLSVRMVPEVKDLGEVEINTGYQRLRSNEINGTVSTIDEKMLNARTGTNILDRIIGQSSGVILNVGKSNGNPQNKTNISIRGLGTINGPLDPLIVLDGYIYEGDINNINPYDIENVSILKDASAASIWGARAGNGVIVITSKKGKNNQDLLVSFNANTTVKELPDLSTFSLMSSSDYVDFERTLFDRGYFDSRIASGNQSLTPAVELFLARKLGRISVEQENTQLALLRETDVRDSYRDNFYTNSILQQYALNLRGGTQKISYALSGSYDHSRNENYASLDRLNLRFSQEFKLTKKLSFSSSFTVNSIATNSGRPAYGTINSANRQPVYLAFKDKDGNPLPVAQGFRNSYLDTLGGGRLLDWKYYPSEDYKHNTVGVDRKELYGIFGLKYKVSDDVNIELGYQLQRQTQKAENRYSLESYYSRNLVNSFTQINPGTKIIKYNVPKGGILRSSDEYVSSATGRVQVNFAKNFGPHSLTAIVGAEARELTTKGLGSLLYGYQQDPLTFGNVDYVNAYPNFITGSTSQIPSGSQVTDLRYRFVSLYANLGYTFMGKYSLSGSVRRDGSSIFGANTNDQWKPLWSAGAGWDVAGENFYNVKWLPSLRLTTTFGYSGNVDLTKTASPIAFYGTNSLSGLQYARIRSINNPDLKWEQTSQVNVRLDFATRKQRIRGSVAFYVKHGSDLYGLSPYDYTTWGGAQELIRNVADMRGYGVDAELHTNNLVSSGFKWLSDLYYNYNTNKTVKYYTAGITGISGFLGGGTSITPVIGKPLYAVSAYRWGGLDKDGNPLGYLNGNLSSDYTAMAREANLNGDNIVYKGPSSPAHFGSLINTFQYGNFSLSVNVSYRFGYFVTKPSISYSDLAANGISHGDYSLRWQKPGDELLTDIPSFFYPVNLLRDAFFLASEVNVIPADHIRLDYVNFNYRVNAGGWKFPFRTLDLYVNATDLGILWRANRYGIDPDYVRSINPFKGITIGFKGSF